MSSSVRHKELEETIEMGKEGHRFVASDKRAVRDASSVGGVAGRNKVDYTARASILCLVDEARVRWLRNRSDRGPRKTLRLIARPGIARDDRTLPAIILTTGLIGLMSWRLVPPH